jgi:drug/metabolite transporter (DMT)-like permease
MKNKRYILVISVALLLFLNLAAGVLIKASPAYYSQGVLLGGLIVTVVGIYFLQTMAWLLLGKHYQLSFVYPFLGINYVLSLFVGMTVFHEPFIWRRLAGAVIILCGVSLLSFSKHRNEVRTAGGSV